MIEIGLTVEGQRGLASSRWQRLVLAIEELGFAGLPLNPDILFPNFRRKSS
ncbi:MAG: hypothetical protein AAF629_27225 [Chloroflexota bacterium]